MISLPLASMNSGFLPYWLCRFSLLYHIAMSASPKHTSSIPSSCLPSLCYSLHKYLDTHSHQQNLPLNQIIVFNMLSHIPLNFLGLSFPPSTKTSQLHRLKIVLSCFTMALWLMWDWKVDLNGLEEVFEPLALLFQKEIELCLYIFHCVHLLFSHHLLQLHAHLQSSFDYC